MLFLRRHNDIIVLPTSKFLTDKMQATQGKTFLPPSKLAYASVKNHEILDYIKQLQNITYYYKSQLLFVI